MNVLQFNNELIPLRVVYKPNVLAQSLRAAQSDIIRNIKICSRCVTFEKKL